MRKRREEMEDMLYRYVYWKTSWHGDINTTLYVDISGELHGQSFNQSFLSCLGKITLPYS